MADGQDVSRKDLEDEFKRDPKSGIEFLECFFKHEIGRHIKCVGQGALRPEDLSDIYHDVILAMIQAVKKPGFDPRDPMGLVYSIAHNKTIDFLRRKGYRAASSLDDALSFLAEDFKSSTVELRWKYLSADEQATFRQALYDVINGLPEMQRVAATVFVDEYENIRGRNLYEPMAARAREILRRDITASAIKRSWHEARKKIIEEFERRGIDLFSTG
jgi:hypothetical protein